MSAEFNPTFNDIEILVVEDSPTQLARLKHVLEEHHHRVVTASNGEQAIALLSEHKPAIVITDIVMPGMDGYELCRRIKSAGDHKEVPVILLTSLSDSVDVIKGLECGADNFITKPYSDAYLLSIIRHVHANKELRLTTRMQAGVEIVVGNQRYFITSDRQQILDLLISTYEAAVQRNTELSKTRDELQALNEHLEELVEERTAALRESEERYRSVAQSAHDAIVISDAQGIIVGWNNGAQAIFGYREEEVLGQSFTLLASADHRDEYLQSMTQFISTGQPEGLHKVVERIGLRKGGEEFPMEMSDARWETAHGVFVSAIVRDITERKQAEEKIQRQLAQLTGLRVIDQAITASFELQITLDVLLEQVTTLLSVDAADVLLLNPYLHTLKFSSGRGFRTRAIENTHLHLGEGLAGRAALERCMIHISNLQDSPDPLLTKNLAGENFVCYCGVPLIAKGQVKGVMEVFHRTRLNSEPEWLSFLEALAGQAAIAVDNAELFNGLHRSNAELMRAYDATIEGWSRALDLRDKETEGHTQRVTEMTLHLAQAMGHKDEDLVHIRRGALLHDMGKLGVPDHILLKPDKLTDDEWVLMKKHPQYAYDMLAPIDYLRRALDIPYCHHEKWDGTGYPRGLKDEQIPLAARIFAVVDVWDALRSDRPYRPAWDEEKVRQHIQSLSGTHFDPNVVPAFLRMME